MSILVQERPSDSPYLETITHGWTVGDGSPIRPAECHWHMVLVRQEGVGRLLVVGPWTTAGIASWTAGAEILWLKFKLGVFMNHLPTRDFLDSETILPYAASKSFWLNGSAWQFPDHENVETFIDRLVRDDILACDPIVNTVLQGHPLDMSARTVRHRFLRAAGLTQTCIQQMQRAQRAAELLQQGVAILDTVHAAGYFDQPHLTRSLKRFVGKTPAQLFRPNPPKSCRLIQDSVPLPGYHTNVLTMVR